MLVAKVCAGSFMSEADRKLGERIVAAGAEIVRLHTGLPANDIRQILDEVILQSTHEFGFPNGYPEDTPLSVRYAIAQLTLRKLETRLFSLRVAPARIALVLADLDSFYRGVRGMPAQESMKAP